MSAGEMENLMTWISSLPDARNDLMTSSANVLSLVPEVKEKGKRILFDGFCLKPSLQKSEKDNNK